jgi:predicted nucleotidyltransferase
MIYTIEQLKELVEPIARRNKLKSLWVFGSYARGEATEESDIDILIDYTDSNIKGLLSLSDLFDQFEEVLKKKVDIISTNSLYGKKFLFSGTEFADEVTNERILLYEY